MTSGVDAAVALPPVGMALEDELGCDSWLPDPALVMEELDDFEEELAGIFSLEKALESLENSQKRRSVTLLKLDGPNHKNQNALDSPDSNNQQKLNRPSCSNQQELDKPSSSRQQEVNHPAAPADGTEESRAGPAASNVHARSPIVIWIDDTSEDEREETPQQDR